MESRESSLRPASLAAGIGSWQRKLLKEEEEVEKEEEEEEELDCFLADVL